jgi:hypothetical protein
LGDIKIDVSFFETLNKCFKFIVKNKRYPSKNSDDEKELKIANFIDHKLKYIPRKESTKKKIKNFWLEKLPKWNWENPIKSYKIYIEKETLLKWIKENERKPKRNGEEYEKEMYKIYDKLRRSGIFKNER